MKNAFDIVRDFEQAVCEYTNAPYCVAVNSCTSALFTCLVYHGEYVIHKMIGTCYDIEIPKKTYIGVGQSILNAGMCPKFRDEEWSGEYLLKSGAVEKFYIYDSARRFTSNMYIKNSMMCTSHHWSKILPMGHGGCILHDNFKFDTWARKFRFDGRTEGIAPKDDNPIRGHHLYLLPELAASGLLRLLHLPKNNPNLPNSDYPDLSQLEIFK